MQMLLLMLKGNRRRRQLHVTIHRKRIKHTAVRKQVLHRQRMRFQQLKKVLPLVELRFIKKLYGPVHELINNLQHFFFLLYLHFGSLLFSPHVLDIFQSKFVINFRFFFFGCKIDYALIEKKRNKCFSLKLT